MATTSTPARRQRAAKASAQRHAGLLPLIVDAESISVLNVVPVSTGRTAKSGGAAEEYELVCELKPTGGTPVRYAALLSGKRHEAVEAARALADDGPVDLEAGPAAGGMKDSLLRSLLEKTLASFREVQGRHADLTVDEMIREVGETLADKGSAPAVSEEQGWQELLERGLRSKTALLKSIEFKATAQASELLGVGEPAIRRRIRERKLFALKAPGDGGHRIPAWALDPEVAGAATAALHASAPGVDEWQLYHFLSTPNGNLNGLRPFECLMSVDNLPPPRRAAREELLAEMEPGSGASLLDAVLNELKADSEESRPA